MKLFQIAFMMLAASFMISACSLLPGITDKAVGVVQKYCANASLLERQAIRAHVNGELVSINPADPPTVKIHCPGDVD